jgi:TatA/E family protein of Tat protein translocase
VGSFGFLEMGTVLVLALLVFGPDRLPEVARNLAKLIARFREETTRSLDELKRVAQVEGLDGDIKGLRDEYGRLKSEVKGFKTDLTRSLDGPSGKAKAKGAARAVAPPFDPDAT